MAFQIVVDENIDDTPKFINVTGVFTQTKIIYHTNKINFVHRTSFQCLDLLRQMFKSNSGGLEGLS